MPSVEMKGTSFRTMLSVVEERFDEETRAEVLASLGGEAGESLRAGAVVSSGWYPCAWYGHLLDVAGDVTGKGPPLSIELGRLGTRRDLGGVYRLLTFVLTPTSLLKKGPRVFDRYYRNATMKLLDSSATSVTAHFDCPGFDETLWNDLTGGITGVVEACGGRGVELEKLSLTHAGSSRRMQIRWR